MVQRYISPFLRRAASKQAVFLLSIVLVMLVSFQCVKLPTDVKMPVVPMQMSMPMVDRTFYFRELVAKDDKFDSLGDGEVVYRPSNMENTPTAIPIPTLTPVAASLSNKLGSLPLSVSGLPGVQLSLSQMLGQTPPPQIPWALGDQTIDQSISVMADTASFDWAQFSTARMVITLQNTMNFAVTFPYGITIYNIKSASDTNEVLATIYPSQLNANSTVSVSTSLSGKTMWSQLRLKFKMQTVGLQGTVPDPNGKLIASMSIDGGSTGTKATMQSAKVRIVDDFGMMKDEGSLQVLDDSLYISRAEFSKGRFDLKITNNVPVDIVAGLVLKELINKQTGEPFKLKVNGTGVQQDSIVIPRNSVFVQPVDLSQYVFQSQTVSGGITVPQNAVHYTLTMRSLKATSDKRVISVDNDMSAALIPNVVGGNVQPYAVSKFSGVVHPTTVSVEQSVDTKFGDVNNNFTADKIDIDNATIIMKLYSQTTYPVDLDMKVTAVREGRELASMNVPHGNGGLGTSFRVLPGDTARVIFNKSTAGTGTTIDQFINSFLEGGRLKFPDKIVLKGAATIQPTDTYKQGVDGIVGTATDHDSLYSSLEFIFPMRFTIQNAAFQDTVELNNDIDEKQLNMVEGGTVTFEVENTFPAEVDLNLILKNDKTSPDTALNVTKTPIHIAAAQYNPSGSNTPVKSFSTVTLGKGEAVQFSKAKFSLVKAQLQTSNGDQPVSFRTSDHIRIRTFGSFKMNVNFEDLGGNDSTGTNSNNNNPNNNNPNNNNPR